MKSKDGSSASCEHATDYSAGGDSAGGDSAGGDSARVQCLEAQVEALQREVKRLQTERASLLAALNERDFERPPHWQER